MSIITDPVSSVVTFWNAHAPENLKTHPAAATPTPVDVGTSAPITGPAYQALDATTKRDRLWRAVSAQPYATLPKLGSEGILSKNPLSAITMLARPSNFTPAFDLPQDVRPDHEKLFHPFGTTAMARFEPDPSSPYTGLFKSGAPAMVRLSLGADDVTYIPGIAMKLFVNGQPSVNVTAIPSLDAQADHDFFSGNPATDIPAPTSAKLKFANYLLSRVANPTHRSVDGLGRVDTRGNAIANPKSPTGVIFRAPAEVHMPKDTKEDFRTALAKLRPGQVIYEVYSFDNPSQRLGAVRLETPFVASAFQDRQLDFQHQR